MADYPRKFAVGRQSEQLYNEELHKIYESVKHLLDVPASNRLTPDAALNGSLWLNLNTNELKYYDKTHKQWVNVFKNKFQLIDQMLDHLAPADPIYGQLWLNNGVLFYFDGTTWKPVRALAVDGSKLNVSAFEDFIILSPLTQDGNMVVPDNYDLALLEYQRAVLENKLDPDNNSAIVEVDPFALNTTQPWDDVLQLPLIPPDVKSQFLVTNINIDRIFMNQSLSTDYEIVNAICVQYPKREIINKVPSLVHVNPGKITNIKKKLIKIDRFNPTIKIKTYNTEFYGFHKNSIYGDFLIPSDTSATGDYIVVPEGINLNYNASQHYDYVLAVTYHFSWIKASGVLTKTSSNDQTTSYFLSNAVAPLNIFAQGFDLENRYWDYDGLSQTLTIKENTLDLEVSIWHTIRHEYGWIKEYTVDGRGIIKLLNKYQNPLVFVNGQAMNEALGDIEIDGNMIYVVGARRDMCWGVVECNDAVNGYNMFLESGVVSETNAALDNVIYYDQTKFPAGEGVILFIGGLLVKKEEVIRNTTDGYVTVNGLLAGQEYILLRDKFHNLFPEEHLSAAFVTGRTDESMVYMNKQLILNSPALITTNTLDDERIDASNNQIRAFVTASGTDYRIYNWYEDRWDALAQDDIDAMKLICFSYENTMNAIKINVPYTSGDMFDVYAYNFANRVENPLIVRSFWANDENDFAIQTDYIAEIGSLSVWVNGIRQYNVKEYADGKGFALPQKVSGKVTYIIEKPKRGQTMVCEREILGPANLTAASPNVYKTKTSLYPGRVTVYVSGLRVPKESWTILDNNTILFKDPNTMLIGHSTNYPIKTIAKPDGTPANITMTTYDEILIEVRQEFERVEQTIQWQELNNWDIGVEKYNLPREIMEASDEILIFVNGQYTGLRNEFGYRKDRTKGAISILSSSVIEALCLDPLYKILMENNEKQIAWKAKYGTDYTPNINNMITLEWR